MSKVSLPFFLTACLMAELPGSEPHGESAAEGKKPVPAKETAATPGKAPESNPQLRPKPDSAFSNALDWNDGAAEILVYQVKRIGKAGEFLGQGRLVTERMLLHADGLADRRASGKDDVEILNALLLNYGDDNGASYSFQTTVKLARHDALRLLKQDQSLAAWPGTSYRSLDCRVTPPRLKSLSSGGEGEKDSVLTRWPVYTEAMLFTYLRAIPLRAGYREEVWFQDWAGEGSFVARPQFAAISVHSKTTSVRELDTWYVTLDRDDGHRSEFWISATGLHPVVLAILSDHSEWTLQGISRKKYWAW
ncbi:MAG: hypothetical protein ABI036_16450 [Fibrobacteria bacterium]